MGVKFLAQGNNSSGRLLMQKTPRRAIRDGLSKQRQHVLYHIYKNPENIQKNANNVLGDN